MIKLLFVYNAESGVANALLDYGKKYISPDTYDCQLCMVSYGPFGMKRDWKKFTSSLSYPVEFLHKDELAKDYPSIKTTLPALVRVDGQRFDVLLSAKEFGVISSLEQLKDSVKQKLNQ